METGSPSNFDHERKHNLEREEQHPEGAEEPPLPAASQLADDLPPGFDHGEGWHEAAADTNEARSGKIRVAVFAKKDTASDSEIEVEDEPLSLWQKIKHSAVYGNKQKAAAAKSPDRRSRRQNKTGLLVGGVLAVFVGGVWLLYVVSAPVRMPPPEASPTAARRQPQAPAQKKSLTPGLEAHPSEQQPSSGDESVTAADIRATGNGMPAPTSPAKKPASTDASDYALGKIPPLPPVTAASATAPVAASTAAPRNNPLDTTALVFVRHPPKDSSRAAGASIEPAFYQPAQPALALQSHEFDSLVTGTRLVARLETPVSTAVSLPAIATVEYNYEDKDHTLLIPAGSRVFGTLEQADSQGFMGLHFQSIQRPSDPAPIPFEARAIGLNFQPLKGIVTGRNRGRRFLVRAASGIGQMAAATLGMNRGTGAGDALNSNVLIREQLMNNIGSAGDQEIQQMAYSERPVVTLAANTRFYLVIDRSPKQRGRRAAQTPRATGVQTNSASIQAQLLELRKELADITAKQTPLTSEPAPVPISGAVGTTGATAPPSQQ